MHAYRSHTCAALTKADEGATVGVEAPQLFDALANAAATRLNELNSQDLANTAWAFATASQRDERLTVPWPVSKDQRLTMVYSKLNSLVMVTPKHSTL